MPCYTAFFSLKVAPLCMPLWTSPSSVWCLQPSFARPWFLHPMLYLLGRWSFILADAFDICYSRYPQTPSIFFSLFSSTWYLFKASPVYNRSHTGWGPHLLGEYFAGDFWGLLLLHPSVYSFALSFLHSGQLFLKTLLFQFRLRGIFVFPSCMKTEFVAFKTLFFFFSPVFFQEKSWEDSLNEHYSYTK